MEKLVKKDKLIAYLDGFQFSNLPINDSHPKIKAFIDEQIQKMDLTIKMISSNNFWELYSVILGIDSKLVLVKELLGSIDEFDLSDKEVIKMVERDYYYYNKELCGYRIDDTNQNSLIFNIK
jgi:hypothetical protein